MSKDIFIVGRNLYIFYIIPKNLLFLSYLTEIAIYFREEHVERGRNQQFWGRNQEEPIIFGGGTGRNQEEPGGTRRNWEEPGGTYLVSPVNFAFMKIFNFSVKKVIFKAFLLFLGDSRREILPASSVRFRP